MLNELTAISPIDGRYRNKVESLAGYFSESALIKYRILVEVEYFIALCNESIPQLKKVNKKSVVVLRKLYQNYTEKDGQAIKDIEKITNHDVKAVEYFIKKHLGKCNLTAFSEFIHFGLTSQDINNTAIPLSLKEFTEKEYLPVITSLTKELNQLASSWKNIPMLARTHGQPASPTRLGKEVLVFVERLSEQVRQLKALSFPAKFGGATGNFNAHHVAYPNINWMKFADTFVNKTLGLKRSRYTTQIEHYDNLAAIFDCYKRINTILIDFSRDMWTYISMDYFGQKINKNEVGSSAMPHKVNPIDFENAEGNLGIANAIFEHLSAKLPVSRLQRDLTDSTVLRNIGVPAAHTIISIKSIQKGLGKLLLNKEKIKEDLEANWAVVAEAIQTILRREGYPKPYEALKALTRKNEKITAKTISQFIHSLKVSEKVRKELLNISPASYTGV